MELRINPRDSDFMLQRLYVVNNRRIWKNVAGPYRSERNARVGLKHYQKYRGEDFNTRVGRQLMALKNWGDVKL